MKTMKKLSPSGDSFFQTVKEVAESYNGGKEESLKETHQGCLSVLKSFSACRKDFFRQAEKSCHRRVTAFFTH